MVKERKKEERGQTGIVSFSSHWHVREKMCEFVSFGSQAKEKEWIERTHTCTVVNRLTGIKGLKF